MTHSLSFKQSLFLVLFTVLIGSHVDIFRIELMLAFRNFFYPEMVSGVTRFVLNERGISFLLKLLLALTFGLFLVPRLFKNNSFRFIEKIGFSFITFIPLLIFADTFFFKMFIPGSSYLHRITNDLYFVPFLLIIALYILPKFMALAEYNPVKSFKGGLLLCGLILPFAWLYDIIFNQYPYYLSTYSQWLQSQPEENYIYYFIGYLIGKLEFYISTYGLIMHFTWFITSGISTWFAYLVIYQSNLKNWQEEATVFK